MTVLSALLLIIAVVTSVVLVVRAAARAHRPDSHENPLAETADRSAPGTQPVR